MDRGQLDFLLLDGAGSRYRVGYLLEPALEEAPVGLRLRGEGRDLVFDGQPGPITKIMMFNLEHYIMNSKAKMTIDYLFHF